MSTRQPEALWLADLLITPYTECNAKAAAELRRLHAENSELLEVLRSTADLLHTWIDGAPPYDESQDDRDILAKARAAIAKAEGENQ